MNERRIVRRMRNGQPAETTEFPVADYKEILIGRIRCVPARLPDMPPRSPFPAAPPLARLPSSA